MKKKDNDFDDFSIEEKDDPRTWTDELVQDCAQPSFWYISIHLLFKSKYP